MREDGIMAEQTQAETVQQMRRAMRRLAQSVSVISTRHRDRRMAMAATAVNSLSLDPPAMLVTVNRDASLFAALRAGERFCINILRDDQQEIAECCGGRLKGEERFDVGKWEEVEGLPALVDAQARLICQQDGFLNYGTHGIFIGRVLHAEAAEAVRPLLYADGAYRRLGA